MLMTKTTNFKKCIFKVTYNGMTYAAGLMFIKDGRHTQIYGHTNVDQSRFT